MTVPDREVAEYRTEPASTEVLFRSLHRLEHQPLDVQVELLDAVHRGLDAALGQSGERTPDPTPDPTPDATRAWTSGPARQPSTPCG